MRRKTEKIIVEPRSPHGRKLFYPVCDKAKIWLKALRRSKAFTPEDLEALKQLDVEVCYGFAENP